MFAGYNILLENFKPFSDFHTFGEKIRDHNEQIIKERLDQFIGKGGVIDGSSLQEYWFPQMEGDVFISHSHQDEELALGLSGWLFRTFGLKSFIDSCVWGYSKQLLKQIDDEYCFNPGRETYDYNKRNFSTSHVYTMLSSALGMMIDRTECLFFLNTPKSITSSDTISKTHSPWLFLETGLTQILRRKSPQAHRELKLIFEEAARMKAKKLDIEYEVSFTALEEIDQSTLTKWDNNWKREKDSGRRSETHALDHLYAITDVKSTSLC